MTNTRLQTLSKAQRQPVMYKQVNNSSVGNHVNTFIKFNIRPISNSLLLPITTSHMVDSH